MIKKAIFIFSLFISFATPAYAFIGFGASPVWVTNNNMAGRSPSNAILWETYGALVAWGDGTIVTWE